MKKFLMFLLIAAIIGGAVIYHYRYDIFQFSAEKIIKDNLPPYVNVGSIVFDLENGTLKVKDLSIKNPQGYYNKYLARLDEITCRYRMKGKNVLDGIVVTEITADSPLINIERLRGGRMNVNEMSELMGGGKGQAKSTAKGDQGSAKNKFLKDRSISDLIELPNTIYIKKGKVIFTDKDISSTAYKLTFEDINGNLDILLNNDYNEVLSVASKGSGALNGDMGQKISWNISLDPNASALTMGNTYNINNVDVTVFRPYYEEYSPILIESCRASGTLVFNFDNGNIGSTNTLYLNGLKFKVKQGQTGAKYWETALPDVIKYLQSSSGQIVFDFKIKGPMDSPRFYPGPNLKTAMQNMVVDKVSNLIEGFTKEGDSSGAAQGAAQGEKSDVQKAVDIFKSLINE